MGRRLWTLVGLWALSASLCGCGESADDAANAVGAAKALMAAAKDMKQAGQAADQAARVAEEKARAQIPEGATEQEAQQFVDQAKALAAMQALQRAGGTGPITNWRQLTPFLPDALGDFKATGKLEGSTTKAGGIKLTQVKRRYRGGERDVDISISDTFLSPMLRAPFKMAAVIEEDSSNGYKKGTRIAGNTAIVEWHEPSKRSKAMILAGERFMVDVQVRGTPTADDAVKLAQLLDLGGLAKVVGEEEPAPATAAAAAEGATAAKPAEPAAEPKGPSPQAAAKPAEPKPAD